MGNCCSKKPEPAHHKNLSSATSVQPTVLDYENSEYISFSYRDLDLIDERCADVPTYSKRRAYTNYKKPTFVPSLKLYKVTPVPTPIDEEAVQARRAQFAGSRKATLRKLPIVPTTVATDEKITDSQAQDTALRTGLSPESKPPLVPRKIDVKEKRDTNFASYAGKIRPIDLLSPKSISTRRNRSPNSSLAPSSPGSSERPKDLLTVARRMSLEKSDFEGKASIPRMIPSQSLSPKNVSSRYDNSPSNASIMSPGFSDIMNSDLGSLDGEFPSLFTASFGGWSSRGGFAKDTRETEESKSGIALLKTKGNVLRTDINSKAKLPDGTHQVNQYILERKIGTGSFGVVFAAKNTHTGKECAIKVTNKRLLLRKSFQNKAALNELKREIETLSSLKHPNIIEVYEVIEGPDSNKAYLVLELATHGSSMELSPMKLDDVWKYFRQLVSALHYLHEVALYVHRDVKPHNLLINGSFTLKLSDFGTAQRILHGDELSNIAGTHAFMAPEMLNKDKSYAGKPLDMWAAGVTLYYFINGCPPFKSRKIPQLYEQIKSDPIIIPKRLEPALQELLRGLLNRDSAKRLTVKQVMQHPWVTRQGTVAMD